MSDESNVRIMISKRKRFESSAEGCQRRYRRNLRWKAVLPLSAQQPKMLGCQQCMSGEPEAERGSRCRKNEVLGDFERRQHKYHGAQPWRTLIKIIIIKRFIRRSNMARVTTRVPYNVRCSYSARQFVSEVGTREQMCLEHIFAPCKCRCGTNISGRLFHATGPATQNVRLPSCSLVLGIRPCIRGRRPWT